VSGVAVIASSMALLAIVVVAAFGAFANRWLSHALIALSTAVVHGPGADRSRMPDNSFLAMIVGLAS